MSPLDLLVFGFVLLILAAICLYNARRELYNARPSSWDRSALPVPTDKVRAARALYYEVDGDRNAFIARRDEIGLSHPGASAYYFNIRSIDQHRPKRAGPTPIQLELQFTSAVDSNGL